MGFVYFCSCFSIYASLCLLFSGEGICSSGGNQSDQHALFQFKAGITADPFQVMASWNRTTHFCQWYGVTCGHRHKRVTILNLTSSKLVGTISPYIGNLSFLKVLDLKNNSFTQNIPLEIGRLQRLQEIHLNNNSLTNEIPSNISKCSNLIVLKLGWNSLSGQVPIELGYLSKLQVLAIHFNNLIGTIPHSLGNLSSLLILSARNNKVVGNIPDSIGNIKAFKILGLFGNKLSGTFPYSILNLSSLIGFDIGGNINLGGFLPSKLFLSLPNLQFFSIGGNQFTGFIPNSISNASNLDLLQLEKNYLTGKVPSFEKLNIIRVFSIYANRFSDDLTFLCTLTNSSSLQTLQFHENNFGESLPECIGNLSSKLRHFTVSANQISGKIPPSIGDLVNLERLYLHNNKLSGTIPQSIGKLQKVEYMNFENNKFFGIIPSSFGNLTKVSILAVNNNNLQGSIPSSLANCKYLLELDFSYNHLSGNLPTEVIGLPSLSIFVNFAHNYFTGSLPKEVGNLKALGKLDISNNMLSGEIPTSLGSCISLEYLYISGNRFQGSIPFSLSSLRGLQVIDFSHNNFSGQIPNFFASFRSLLVLNLSFNDFEGPMPSDGAFKNAKITVVKGNKKLCGGIPEFQLPICRFNISNRRRLKVVISTTAGVMFAMLSLALILLRFKKKRQNFASTNSESSLLNLPKISYNDLHKATDGFNSTNLIGSGSFGCVYKGILEGSNQMVAVKVVNLQHHGAGKSFMAECEALRNIKHRNLLKILSACSSIDYQANDFKALVYEFMVNGNLEEWLHKQVGDTNLNLIQRINIAMDVAFAIEYLHHHSGTPIIHCDLKPSNVLLDDEMVAHIGDFGLAKFLSHDFQNSSTNQSSSVGLRGTVGYAPPEYGLGSEVSTKGDVYSYGILLLEIFTGKRPTDEMFKESWNLHKFVESAIPNGVNAIVDPTLIEERGQMDEKFRMECLISLLGIGVSCSVESPTDRMDICDVVTTLQRIKDNLKKSQQ